MVKDYDEVIKKINRDCRVNQWICPLERFFYERGQPRLVVVVKWLVKKPLFALNHFRYLLSYINVRRA